MPKLAVNGGSPVRNEPFPEWPQWTDHERKNLLEVLESGKWFRFYGEKVAEFEKRFAKAHDAAYSLAVTSGTAALEVSMAALGVGPGDEVIVPCYTFVATATAVINAGATPVYADISLDDFNIDLESAGELISPRTKGMIVVHFGGCPCDMDAVMAFARERGLWVVEDAAHAHGGKWAGRGLGSIGDAAGFSFQNSKNITAGEGGMFLTSDESLMNRAFSYHSYGQRTGFPWYSHHMVSRNLRMTEWQGAILLAQLERLEEQTARRMENARKIDAAIAAIPGLATVGSADPRAGERAYHLYQFRYATGIPGVSRKRFLEALSAEGVPCSAGYPVPLYKQPFMEEVELPPGQGAYRELQLPNAEAACEEAIWLAQSLLLGTEKDTDDIIDAIEKVASNISELKSTAV